MQHPHLAAERVQQPFCADRYDTTENAPPQRASSPKYAWVWGVDLR